MRLISGSLPDACSGYVRGSGGPVSASFLRPTTGAGSGGRAFGRMYAGRGPARKKSREHGTTPGEVGYEASTRKPCVKARITVRLWTDSVNPFRHQIYKSLVSVALKPQTAKPSSSLLAAELPEC